MAALRPLCLPSVIGAALLACGGQATVVGGGEGGSGPAGASDLAIAAPDSTAGTDANTECDDALGDRARGGVCIHTITGRLVTESGTPLEGATVTTCANACF